MLNRNYEQNFASGKPSAEFLAVAAALQQLDRTDYIVGYVLAQERDKRYKQQGYTAESGSIRRLVGKSRIPYTNNPDVMPNDPPHDDHGKLFLKDGKPAFYMSQPYGVTWTELQQIVRFCEKWGLQASIDALQSNWYPGRTVAVRYEKRCDTP